MDVPISKFRAPHVVKNKLPPTRGRFQNRYPDRNTAGDFAIGADFSASGKRFAQAEALQYATPRRRKAYSIRAGFFSCLVAAQSYDAATDGAQLRRDGGARGVRFYLRELYARVPLFPRFCRQVY